MGRHSGAIAPQERARPSLALVRGEIPNGAPAWDESSAASLAIFLRYVRRSLEALADPYLEPREVISQAYGILRSLIKREGGTENLSDSLGSFVHQLAAYEAPFRQLCHLYQLLPVILNSKIEIKFEDLPFTHARLREIISQIMEWYVKRCTSILVLNEEGAASTEQDTIFGLHIVEEREEEGMLGFEVVTGVRLVGHAGERLWCKVFFREGERYLAGSSGWCEQVGYGYSARPTKGRVCSIVPLVPDNQRVILDEVRLFVPYQALELHPGRQLLEVVVEIASGDNTTLATMSLPHTFAVQGVVNPESVPVSSPQLRGVWRRDFAKSDGIRSLTAHHEGDCVVIAGTLYIQDRHVRLLEIQCDPLSSDGSSLLNHESDDRLFLTQRVELSGYPSEELSFSFHLSNSKIIETAAGTPVIYELTVNTVDGEVLFGGRAQANSLQ